MKAAKPADGTAQVDAFMAELEHARKPEIEAVRRAVLGASPKLAERVKWNAPSFHLAGRDLGALNLRQKDHLLLVLVFPPGAVDSIRSPILEGDYPDRRLVRFRDLADVEAKTAALQKVVRAWVKQAEAA